MTTIRVVFDDHHTRFPQGWARDAASAGYRAAMRRHATEHGHAFVIRADGGGTLVYRDADGHLRQRSWDRVIAA